MILSKNFWYHIKLWVFWATKECEPKLVIFCLAYCHDERKTFTNNARLNSRKKIFGPPYYSSSCFCVLSLHCMDMVPVQINMCSFFILSPDLLVFSVIVGLILKRDQILVIWSVCFSLSEQSTPDVFFRSGSYVITRLTLGCFLHLVNSCAHVVQSCMA